MGRHSRRTGSQARSSSSRLPSAWVLAAACASRSSAARSSSTTSRPRRRMPAHGCHQATSFACGSTGLALRSAALGTVGVSAGLQVLYEDEMLLVVNKPAGLLAVPLGRRKESASAYSLMADHLGRAAGASRSSCIASIAIRPGSSCSRRARGRSRRSRTSLLPGSRTACTGPSSMDIHSRRKADGAIAWPGMRTPSSRLRPMPRTRREWKRAATIECSRRLPRRHSSRCGCTRASETRSAFRPRCEVTRWWGSGNMRSARPRLARPEGRALRCFRGRRCTRIVLPSAIPLTIE